MTTPTATPTPLQQATQFLSLLFQPSDYITIGSQYPGKKGIHGSSYHTRAFLRALHYVSQLLAAGNQVYFGVLPRKEPLPNRRKGTKADVALGQVAWVDIDFKDNTGKSEEVILLQLRGFSPHPSLIVHSGNGFHAYWLLDTRYEPNEIESVNKGIVHLLLTDALGIKADAAGNCDRTLRLPGSLNLKDPQNKKPCAIVECHPERQYQLHQLPRAEIEPPTERKRQTRTQQPVLRPSIEPPKTLEHALQPLFLLGMLKKMPPHVQRMVACGEQYDPTTGQTKWKHRQQGVTDRSELTAQMVTTLHNLGWTDTQIKELLTSGLPLRGVYLFQEKYGQRAEQEIDTLVEKAGSNERSAGNVLPRLLDAGHWMRGREYIEVDQEHHDYIPSDEPALHRAATLAEQMYSGERQGSYLAALPIGIGKTTQFLVPFVTNCMKRDASKGIIVAMERKADIQRYAEDVNKKFADPVAFALFSCDPKTCPQPCPKHTPEWKAQANHCPLLFLTHEMLSRTGVEPYRAWNGGGSTRVMVILDEKPTAWLGKDSIAEQDISTLREQLRRTGKYKHRVIRLAINDAAKILQTAEHGRVVQLQTKLTPKQVSAFFYTVGDVSDTVKDHLYHALTSLSALGQSNGVLVRDIDTETGETGEDYGSGQIIVSRQRALPGMPTLILDATGVFDPEYSTQIRLLTGSSREGKVHTLDEFMNHLIPVHLVTYDGTLTKSKVKDMVKEREPNPLFAMLCIDIEHRILTQLAPEEQVYIVCPMDHQTFIDELLRSQFPQAHHRFLFRHYGETKGSNAMQDAAAIVLTTVQHKGLPYYRALALATGKGDVAAETRTVGHTVQRFIDQDTEELKVRDQVSTLLQEIGRTRIRQGKPICILLPWADEQGIAALKTQLLLTFNADIDHHKTRLGKPTYRDKILDLLQPGRHEKTDVRTALGLSPSRLSQELRSDAMKKELWGREVQNEHWALVVPKETHTSLILTAAECWCYQAFLAADTNGLPHSDWAPVQRIINVTSAYAHSPTV